AGLEQLKKLAESGFPPAQYCLAHYFRWNRSYAEGFDWLKKAADRGNSHAQADLAYEYMQGSEGAYGRGGGKVKIDQKLAVELYRKSAEQQNSEGEIGLGLCYEEGTGVSKDLAQAQKWYSLAAAHGDETAQMKVALLSDEGA